MTQKQQRQRTLNTSNVLSVIRACLAIAFPILLLSGRLELELLAGVVFSIGAITDFLDGRLARQYGWITTFGKIADPLADKMLTLGAFITFAIVGLCPWWVLIPIAAREIGVTLLRFYGLYHNVAIAAVLSGKQKMWLQIGTLYLMYANFLYRHHVQPASPVPGYLLDGAMYFCLALAFYQTMVSGRDIARNNWHIIRRLWAGLAG